MSLYPASTQAYGTLLLPTPVTIIRPADTLAYVAKDVISTSTTAGTILTFPGMVREAGGTGYLVQARLYTSQATCVAQLRLHLFHTNPGAWNDNVPHNISFASRVNRLATLDFAGLQTDGSGSGMAWAQLTDIRVAFGCVAASTTLYGILEVLTAFTPASAQQFSIALIVDTN